MVTFGKRKFSTYLWRNHGPELGSTLFLVGLTAVFGRLASHDLFKMVFLGLLIKHTIDGIKITDKAWKEFNNGR